MAKRTEEQKIRIAAEFLSDSNSDSEAVGKKYGISGQVVREYANKYGLKACEYITKSKMKRNHYDLETKNKAYDEIRSGVDIEVIADKYNIKLETLKKWKRTLKYISKYQELAIQDLNNKYDAIMVKLDELIMLWK